MEHYKWDTLYFNKDQPTLQYCVAGRVEYLTPAWTVASTCSSPAFPPRGAGWCGTAGMTRSQRFSDRKHISGIPVDPFRWTSSPAGWFHDIYQILSRVDLYLSRLRVKKLVVSLLVGLILSWVGWWDHDSWWFANIFFLFLLSFLKTLTSLLRAAFSSANISILWFNSSSEVSFFSIVWLSWSC